jgi:group I intron endonuclease
MLDIFINKKNMGYIYMLIDKRNGKKYVGKHNGKKTDYWSSGLVPNRIAKKHGKEIFERIILEDNLSDDQLNEKEIFHIEKENSFNEGYNSTIGGEGGNHWVHLKTEEELKAISRIKSEKLTGRVFSEETKKKMSESAKVKIFSQEHKDNIGKAVKLRGGYSHKDETKLKLSKIMSGRKNEIQSEFMSINNPKAQKVSIEGVEYNTIKEACEKLNIHRSTIKYRLNSENEKFNLWFKI